VRRSRQLRSVRGDYGVGDRDRLSGRVRRVVLLQDAGDADVALELARESGRAVPEHADRAAAVVGEPADAGPVDPGRLSRDTERVLASRGVRPADDAVALRAGAVEVREHPGLAGGRCRRLEPELPAAEGAAVPVRAAPLDADRAGADVREPFDA